MWELDWEESWAPRIDVFGLCCWRRLLRVPWSARGSNQSILKEIPLGIHWKNWCWSWNSNTLATSCTELTHWKRLMLAGIGGRRRKVRQRMRWLDVITDSKTWVWLDSRSCWWIGRPGMLWFMGLQKVGHNWATELNWTELIVLERSMRRHKTFCSCAQKIIHKVNHWHLFKDFYKKFQDEHTGCSLRPGRDCYLKPICEENVYGKGDYWI